MFVFADLFVCVVIVGEMFSLSTIDYSYNPFLQSTSLPIRYNQQHGSPLPSSLRLQEVKGIQLILIRGIKFSYLYASQNFKKCIRSR
jgi:hypothetical protein